MAANTSKVTLSGTQNFGVDGSARSVALLSALVSKGLCPQGSGDRTHGVTCARQLLHWKARSAPGQTRSSCALAIEGFGVSRSLRFT